MQTIKLIFALACALLLAGIVSAQSPTSAPDSVAGKSTPTKNPRQNYTVLVTDTDGNPVENVLAYVKKGTTNERGEYVLKSTRYSRRIAIQKEGYQTTWARLSCDSLRRITLYPDNTDRSDLIETKPLQEKFELPIYVTNGQYIANFGINNYTREDFTSIKTSNKWNKHTKEIFKGTSLEKIDIEKRGVVYLKLKDSIPLYTPKGVYSYTIVVTDHTGAPVENANVFIQRGNKSGEDGIVKFKTNKNVRTLLLGPSKYDEYIFKAPADTTLQNITLQPARPQKKAKLKQAKFQGGTLNDFRWWVSRALNPIYYDVLKDEPSTVTISFTVGKSGKVVAVWVVNSNNDALAKEIKRIFYNSPTWDPGVVKGKAVQVKFTIPITIKARNDL